MEILEVFDDVKDKIGDKWFYLLMGGAVLFGLYNLMKDNQTSDNLVTVTGVSSYPDVVTNANVVIDTLQESIDYSEQKIIDEMNKGFEATNDYINKGLESQEKLMDEYMDEMHGTLEGIQTPDIVYVPSGGSTSAPVNPNVTPPSTNISSSTNKKDTTNNIVKNKEPAKTTTTTKPATTTTTKPATTNTYKYQTKSGLNTSTSIVDALKATGADSSFANRQKIAQANGISNYTGTATQNITLLNKLKAGTLKKV